MLDDALNYLDLRFMKARHNTTCMLPTDVSGNGDDSSREMGTSAASTESAASDSEEELVFLLSAADEPGMQRMCSVLQEYLQNTKKDAANVLFRDLAYTLNCHRSSLPWKSTFLASSVDKLVERLGDTSRKPVRSSSKPNVKFIFTGQGAQWAKMGLGLLVYQAFQQSLTQADEYFRTLGATWSLLGEPKHRIIALAYTVILTQVSF